MVWRIRMISASRAQGPLLFFDPRFGELVHDLGIAVCGVDGGADAHRYRSRPLDEGVARPHQPGVVRYRHDRRAARHREPGAADMVFAPLARAHARALRTHRHPESLLEALAAAARDAAHRRRAAPAVDPARAHPP